METRVEITAKDPAVKIGETKRTTTLLRGRGVTGMEATAAEARGRTGIAGTDGVTVGTEAAAGAGRQKDGWRRVIDQTLSSTTS